MQINVGVLLSFAILILGTNYSLADDSWVCTESATQKIGDSLYLACGTAQSPSEAEARKQSLENAIKDFEITCRETESCKKFATEMSPKRSDCKRISDVGYRCYRAVQIEVLPIAKSSVVLNEDKLKDEIEDKKTQLEDLRLKLTKIVELKRLEQQEAELKALKESTEANEVGLLELESRLRDSGSYKKFKPWSIGLFLGLHSIPLNKEPETHYAVGLTTQYKTSSRFSFSGTAIYLTDLKRKGTPNSGSPNSTEDFNQASSVSELSLGAGYHIQNIKFGLFLGVQNYKREIKTVTYSALGIKNGESMNANESNRGMYGADIGYENKNWTTSFQVKSYSGSTHIGFGLNIIWGF